MHEKWQLLETMLHRFSKVSTRENFMHLAPTFDPGKVQSYLERPADSFATQNQAWKAYRLMIAYAWASDLIPA